MRVRFAHQMMVGILLICPLTNIGQEKVEGCTIGVASGKATTDGRPLLWKNRDGSGRNWEVVYCKDGRFKHLAVAPAYDSQWPGGGVNEFGFSAVYSAAFDLPGKSKKGMNGGHIIKWALKQCVTVDDFENILKQTNVSGRTTECNIGVIDAFGGAAIFETGNFSYTRFDATDPKVAPQGYIIRTNFTLTGGGDHGRSQYNRANQLLQQIIEKGQLDYRYVLRKVCRDLSGAEDVSHTLPEMRASENRTIKVLNPRNAISKFATTYVAVFHGVRPNENPSLTTFWAIMGEPIFSVAVPGWVIAESTAPEMDGVKSNSLCTSADDLRHANYVIGNKKKPLLNPDMLPDIWAVTYPAEDRIFDQTKSIMTQWRKDYPTARQVASFHQSMASGAMATLEETIELLVQKGGRTSHLRIALYMRDLEKAKAFIRQGIDVNVLDGHGYTPLHYAVQNDQKEIVQLLISKNADVNVKNRPGQTPLHIASERGNKDIVELLLGKGADVNAKNEKSETPLDIAVSRKSRNDAVELLLAKGADGSTIHSAAFIGNLEKLQSIIEAGSDVNVRDTRKRTALHHAARAGHKQIVELLLERGADVNAGAYYQKTAAESAMDSGHDEIVKLLVAKGAEIAPLNLAVYLRDEAKARSLIEGGADVNKRTPYGTTPLDVAAARGFRDVVELLIDRGAEVNAKDNWNWTPLHYVAEAGHKEIAHLLIAAGADINAKDKGGNTPLSYAQEQGYVEIVQLLRRHGAKE